MTATAKRPRDRKEAILEAAAELFAERGYSGVGVDDIAARVGVTGPAIYRHHRGKAALLVAVLDRASSTLADAVEADDPVRAAVSFVLDHPALTATYLRERPGLDRAAAEPLVAAERRIRHAWSAELRRLRPDLDPLRCAVRERAIVAALTAAARRHPDVNRPRLDELLVGSARAVAGAPLVASGGEHPDGAGWAAPTSKRDEILTAALHLFRLKGVAGVGVDEIGAAAGLSGPTLYHYFDGKAEIVAEAFDRTGERVAVGIADALRVATSPADAVERLMRSYVRVACDNVDLIVVTSREAGALPEAERPRLARRNREVRDSWAVAVGAARPELADAEARLLVRCCFHLVNHAAEAADGDRGLDDEIAALGLAHLGIAEK